ncbi:MAG: PilZ domain-containing protein [Deltaproteobacteria bacterium]|uniref:PilZ domain-containing protein n=1 Tax=Desulforhabdus amnigena TaxID=40218 RepID=A0A9W6D3S9_9BACT|nr:PilZ domain-containing protein [Deltaproteobacteria bacterium]GLI34043.1 hypothetical protein DAMNIGENAA_14760 [Desulforhabdus amnigena]
MVPKAVFVNNENRAVILCSRCGKEKITDASKFLGQSKPIRVKCNCGFSFLITFQRRRHYRKSVFLSGIYSKLEYPMDSGRMEIEDISRTGLRFRTQDTHHLREGDIVRLEFALDDAHNTPLVLTVELKHVSASRVGGEFCDPNVPKALAFYLLP